jgi:hypothetical protein
MMMGAASKQAGNMGGSGGGNTSMNPLQAQRIEVFGKLGADGIYISNQRYGNKLAQNT